MQTKCFLRRNGHMIRHSFDAAAGLWVPAEPIPARKAKPFRPMLAEAYAGGMFIFPTSDEDEKIDMGVIAQPKLDGVRCIARAEGLFSRSGERIANCPHIEAPLRRSSQPSPR